MKKEEILNKIQSDVEYIPTLEELKLIGKNFSLGESPIFKLILMDSADKKLINGIEKETKKERPGGLMELFQCLEVHGYCRSYKDSRIFYLAYILAEKGIEVNIEGLEYRNKLYKQIKAINELIDKI